MITMDNGILEDKECQKIIDFSHAEFMFKTLEFALSQYGMSAIEVKQYDETEKQKCAEAYQIRVDIIRLACEYIEHACKALIIKHQLETSNVAESWNHIMKKDPVAGRPALGHNLLLAFKELSKEEQDFLLTKIGYDRNDKTYNLDNDVIFKVIINNVGLIDEETINQSADFSKMSENLTYKNDLVGSNTHLENNDRKFLETYMTLSDTNPESGQALLVASRYPGQKLVDGPAEFLINLAYALHDICTRELEQKKGETHSLS